MEIVADTLILLVVLQTVLRLSQWSTGWMRLAYCLIVGFVVWQATEYAAALSKPHVQSWLHSSVTLQNIAAVCMVDALLSRLRWYPGLLILPAAYYVLCQMIFTLTGVSFQTTGLLTAGLFVAALLALSGGTRWLLSQAADRGTLYTVITVLICLISLLAASVVPVPGGSPSGAAHPATHQNIIMEYISKALFGIANNLLIPDVILLIFFFLRALLLLITTTMQYNTRRKDTHGSLYTKYRDLLYSHEPDEAYADYLAAQMEAEAAKDVNLSRLLTKLGPVLGLISTLISMSPALVGLSSGDISAMAYNMQVVFSATVVGLFISVVGLFTQQLKSRWHQQDISRLEYVASQYTREK